MSRNFVATLKERQPDAMGRPSWFIEVAFHENIEGLAGDTVSIELAEGTSEHHAKEVIQGLNHLGRRFHVTK